MSFLSKHKVWLLPLLIIGLAILMFVYLKSSKPEREIPQATERAWTVEMMTLERETVHPEQRLYGQVVSNQMVRYVAPINAQVEKVARFDGDIFAANELVLSLNQQEIEIALSLAQADYQEALAGLELEKQAQKTEKARYQQESAILALKQQDLKRNQEMLQRNLSSELSVDQAKDALTRQELALMNSKLVLDQQQAKFSQIQARASRALANLNKTKLNAERSVIRPNFAGRVAAIMVAQGDQVNANTALVEVYAFDSLELRATIPVRYQAALQDALQQEQTVQAWYQDLEGEQQPLILKRLSGQATAAGLDGYFAIPEALHRLRPGELTDVRLALPARTGFVLPYSAIYGSDKVYVVDVESRLQPRSIEILGDVWLDDRKLALVEGALQQGEQVVTSHLPNAISGLLVKVNENLNGN